jgi:hypothetical protein
MPILLHGLPPTALPGREEQGNFAATFARAQAGGATVHFNAADVAAVTVAELAFVGIRGFLPQGKQDFGGKLDVQALIGGDGCDGYPPGVIDQLDLPGLGRVDAAGRCTPLAFWCRNSAGLSVQVWPASRPSA